MLENPKSDNIGNSAAIILIDWLTFVCWLGKPVFELLHTYKTSICDGWLFFSLYIEYNKNAVHITFFCISD